MIRNTTKRQKLGWVLFILYLCLLAYFMFFSESFGRTDTDRGYAYNLVPFKEILRFIRYRGTGVPDQHRGKCGGVYALRFLSSDCQPQEQAVVQNHRV